MFVTTMDQPVQRSGVSRRVLLGRGSLLATMSYLTLSLKSAGPLVAAKTKSDQAEKEKKGSKTITRTFSSPNAVIIDDDTTANPYPSTIQVSGIKKGKVIDVNVRLRGINHAFPDNIDVLLVAPNGASTVLMTDAGGSPDAVSVTLTLDDEAAEALPDNTVLTNGSFKPASYGGADTFPNVDAPSTSANLALLNGGNPNGEWRLFVVDDAATNTGAFSGGWDLQLTIKLDKKKKKKRRRSGKK